MTKNREVTVIDLSIFLRCLWAVRRSVNMTWLQSQTESTEKIKETKQTNGLPLTVCVCVCVSERQVNWHGTRQLTSGVKGQRKPPSFICSITEKFQLLNRQTERVSNHPPVQTCQWFRHSSISCHQSGRHEFYNQVVHFILLVLLTDVTTPPRVSVLGEVRVTQINIKVCNLSILMSFQIPVWRCG